MPSNAPFTLDELARILSARLEGGGHCGSITVSGLTALQAAVPGRLTFLSKPVLAKYLESTRASAVLVDDTFVGNAKISVPLLRVKNASMKNC